MGSKVQGLYLGYIHIYIYIYAISPFVYGIKSKWLIPLVKYAISPFVYNILVPGQAGGGSFPKINDL